MLTIILVFFLAASTEKADKNAVQMIAIERNLKGNWINDEGRYDQMNLLYELAKNKNIISKPAKRKNNFNAFDLEAKNPDSKRIKTETIPIKDISAKYLA